MRAARSAALTESKDPYLRPIRRPAARQSPIERMMTQWAQRVNALYNRKP